jgi:dimethylamine monooxygenase subunit A
MKNTTAALPPQALHLSFEPGPYRMAMGLSAVSWPEWLEFDEHYAEEMALKRALLRERRDDVAILTEDSEAACRETLELLADYLPEHYPGWFSRMDRRLRNHLTDEVWDLDALPCSALEAASLLVQEDLCIVELPSGVPTLTAGVVCFPTRWYLRDKVGRPLLDVHGPVPFYAEKLGRPVDRFMSTVKPGHVAMRLNWSVLDDATLFQPGGKFRTDRNEAITVENAGERLFVRVERQTLTRLPASGAVLFAIRVHVYPIARMAKRPGIAARLAGAIRALPPETAHYKSLARLREPLLAYLDAA